MVRKRILEFIASQLGVTEAELLRDPRALENLGIDSLDMVELVMESEEEFG